MSWRILIQMLDTMRVETTRPSDDAMDLIAFVQKELG